MENIKLTQFSKGAGCGCKIAPQVLQEILSGLHSVPDKNLLVGNESSDDAAVYDLGNGQCVVSTTDFFMPIVDDPFDFGRIAATNAISDIYAMGGKPLMAIAILGWPIEKIPTEIAKVVLQGATQTCREAGIPLAGGHSINSLEPIFGLAVTGTVQKEQIKKNNAVKPGDLLYLTKPIGAGILSTAQKRGKLEAQHYPALLKSMTTLNSFGAVCGELDYVHAMTDVTGFGLLGHLREMVEKTECAAKIEVHKVPLMEGTAAYAKDLIYPDGTTRNYNSVISVVEGLSGMEFITLCDPQTSGGLLIAVDAAKKEEFEKQLQQNNMPLFYIGEIITDNGKKIVLVP